MALYDARDGDLGTSYSWTSLTKRGAETVGDVLVPPGATRIAEIWVSLSSSVWTDTKGAIIAAKLKGGGLPGVDYEFVCGGLTVGAVTTEGAQHRNMKARIIKTNLAVKAGSAITVQGAQITDSDMGTPHLAIGLVFDSGGGSKRNSYLRFGIMASLTTKYPLTLDAVGATVNSIPLPGSAKRITNVISAVGGVTLATATGGVALTRLEGGGLEESQVMVSGAHAALNTTEGVNSGLFQVDAVYVDLPVKGGSQLSISGEQLGTDWGTPQMATSVEVEE
jgi:hypothetical protein